MWFVNCLWPWTLPSFFVSLPRCRKTVESKIAPYWGMMWNFCIMRTKKKHVVKYMIILGSVRLLPSKKHKERERTHEHESVTSSFSGFCSSLSRLNDLFWNIKFQLINFHDMHLHNFYIICLHFMMSFLRVKFSECGDDLFIYFNKLFEFPVFFFFLSFCNNKEIKILIAYMQ